VATRYTRVTLEWVLDSDAVEPTPEQQEDPRFVAFLEWFLEVREKGISAIAKNDPGRPGDLFM